MPRRPRSAAVFWASALGVASAASAAHAHVIDHWFSLTGPQVSPPTASTALGEAYLGYNHHTVHFTMVITFTGLRVEDLVPAGPNATSIHLHTGAPGVNGPIVIDLGLWGTWQNTPTGSRFRVDTETFFGGPQGVLNSDWFQNQTALYAGNAYVDVHTAAHPDGEIRGQIPAPWAGALGLASLGLCALTRRRRSSEVHA